MKEVSQTQMSGNTEYVEKSFSKIYITTFGDVHTNPYYTRTYNVIHFCQLVPLKSSTQDFQE